MIHWIRNIIGAIQGFGGCFQCKDKWNWKASHVTNYSNTNGCFPLCDSCWQKATPTEIKHYYRELVRMWRRDGSFYDQEFENHIVNMALKEKDFDVL